ncbi:Dual specificity phosphatase, catalytic domain protein [Aphelenchoides bicaudatus]|nr:Dual specificity phosphatase, catalytic domain protein [Aphelenchoides bicaudatus]
MALVNVRRPSSLIDKEENPITCPESMCITNSWAHTASIDVNESYFTVRGAAVILSHSQQSLCPTNNVRTEFLHEIEVHLQNMLRLLRPQDTLAMAVRLQNKNPHHARYLALVNCTEKVRESALIGFDCLGDEHISIGLTAPFSANANVELDGDAGILVELSSSAFYIFKPVSLQALWHVFQNLNKELRKLASPLTGTSPQYHNWLQFYQDSAIATADDALCSLWQTSLLDEAMRDDLKATANIVYTESIAELEDEAIISGKLKEIMQNSDLDEVTSRDIRKRLEAECTVSLPPYKEFIDRTIMFILGQMEKPSKIFDYLYLGTEWNAANYDELERNKIKYILNVSKEIDNFFPAHFDYLKIFIADDVTTSLVNIWQQTFKFIKMAKQKDSVLLVHCKKGISRSASIVIAYAMKEYGWNLDESYEFVRQRRSCIAPNTGFLEQLKTFAGMLSASRKSAVFQ